ncbi:MAG: hypothetical protein KY451_11865 [Actinobacteria bacterium]|nr:hypothetical protein [Actinomycetota bacterium]
MPPAPTLVAEATRRSGVVWVGSPTAAPTLVWHLWHDDAVYVVCGGSEQSLPALGPTATVTVRSKSGSRVVDWAASVHRVEPGTERWVEVAPLLAAARLNAADAAGLIARWATSSTVLRLSPTGVV